MKLIVQHKGRRMKQSANSTQLRVLVVSCFVSTSLCNIIYLTIITLITGSCRKDSDFHSFANSVTRNHRAVNDSNTALGIAVAPQFDVSVFLSASVSPTMLQLEMIIENNDTVDVALAPGNIMVYWLPSQANVGVLEGRSSSFIVAIDSVREFIPAMWDTEWLATDTSMAHLTFIVVPRGQVRKIRLFKEIPQRMQGLTQHCRYLSGEYWVPLWGMDHRFVKEIVNPRLIPTTSKLVKWRLLYRDKTEVIDDSTIAFRKNAVTDDILTQLSDLAHNAKNISYRAVVTRIAP